MSMSSVRRRRSMASCCSSRSIIKTATVAAAALAVATTSVTALQPRQAIKAQSPRTSTSLDYVNVAIAPEPETETRRNTRRLAELEKLLRLELTMEKRIPLEVGVTARDTMPAPPLLPAPKTNHDHGETDSTKKKRVLKRHRKTTTTAPKPKGTTSRLAATAPLQAKTGKSRKRTDLESVYWWKRDSKQLLLTREEEIEATDKIRALRRAEHVRDEHLHDQMPLTEGQWAVACGLESPLELRRVIRQGQEARSLLVQANMGLVTAIAKRLHSSLRQLTEAGNGVGTILTLQDFLQEGQIGLIKAAERFDVSRGVRFSTYATWWIRQRIQRSISDSSRIIRLPAHVHSKLMKIRRAKKAMHAEIGREPSEPELAHYLEMPVDKLRQYTKSSLNVVSLENPLRPTNHGKSDLDTRTLGDTIVSDAPTPLEDAQDECLRKDLEQVLLDALTPMERAVMIARYGLEDGHSKTLEETSRAIGVSRERVRLVEAKALNKLRSPQTNYRLKTYIGGGSATASAGKTTISKTIEKASRARKSKTAPMLENKGTTAAAATSRAATPSKGKNSANPFALPFEYCSMTQPESRRRSNAASDNNQAVGEGHETAYASAGPDRLWFL